MLKLSDKHSDFLLNQPESGMGYQIVETTNINDNKQKCIVYNAELLVYFEELTEITKYASYKVLLEQSENSLYKIKDLKVISDATSYKLASITESQGALQSPTTYTKKNEIFKRFSAYEKDKRITIYRGLLPGTYATTEDDAKHITTGMDAVARYALPNSAPATYVFTIKPWESTDVKRGIVQPANNQPGGGVEIIFITGTHSYTVNLPPSTIPAK